MLQREAENGNPIKITRKSAEISLWSECREARLSGRAEKEHHMNPETRWQERYLSGDLPWDNGNPDHNLVRVIDAFHIGPCRALEIGCGTGTNAIWLAQHGFGVTAIDLAAEAIEQARAKAETAGADIRLATCNILTDPPPGGPYGFVFDRGCFHSFDETAERDVFAARVHACLNTGGHWLTLMGSTDGPPRDMGPPRLSCRQFASVLEPLFEILELRTSVFDPDVPDSPRSWACLMRKRE